MLVVHDNAAAVQEPKINPGPAAGHSMLGMDQQALEHIIFV
jgi:hypothetical protein